MSVLTETEVAQLMTEVQPRLRATILHIVRDEGRADELTQDALLKVWKNQAAIEHRENFAAWANRIARNTALDELKSGHRKKEVLYQSYREATEDGTDPEFEDETSDVGEAFEAEERRALLEAKMAALQPSDRTILRLWAFDELSHAQIGRRLGCSEGVSKMRLFRAKRALAAAKARPIYNVPRRIRGRSKDEKGRRVAALLASLGIGSGQSLVALAHRAGLEYANTYSLLKKHCPDVLRRIVREYRAAVHRASKWGVTLAEARATGFVSVAIPAGETAGRFRSQLAGALNQSKLTRAWRWSTKRVEDRIEVRRGERWTTMEGDPVTDFGAVA